MLRQLSRQQFIELSIEHTVSHELQMGRFSARYDTHARTNSSTHGDAKPVIHADTSKFDTFLFLLI